MLLDLAVGTPLFALPLILIGLCLVLYGKEILEVLSFPIGALAGGVLAYMILKGFLAPYEINIWFEASIAFIMVILGGILGPGTMVMVVSVLISLAAVDSLNIFLGDGNQTVAWIIGSLLFAVIIYPAQRYLNFSSAMCGSILIAASIFILVDSLDPVVRTIIQIAMIIVLTVAGGILQSWVSKKMAKNREESVWVPTMA